MKKIAYLFPGQGAQYAGMGKHIYETSSKARDVFEEAKDILGFDIARICFYGPNEELKNTKNCQPAIFVTSIATLRAFEESRSSLSMPFAMAGLSLGEITALCAAGAIRFRDALSLVRARGIYMDEASCEAPGTMLAIIGLSRDSVQRLCHKTNTYIANLNSPGQIVISGSHKDIEEAESAAKVAGARRTIRLDVGGAFHSPLMESAVKKFKVDIYKTDILKPETMVISNVTASCESEPDVIKANLIAQLKSPTLWEDSIKNLIKEGVAKFIEFAPGRVLTGLMKRIEPKVSVYNIETLQDIENYAG